MSRREDIDNGIWSDPDFEGLSAEAKLLYLWSFTNPRCGMAGIYKVGKGAMRETSLTAEQIDAALPELSDGSFAFYEGGVLWVRARIKHLRTRTEQWAKSIANDLRKIDRTNPLWARFVETYGTYEWPGNTLADQISLVVHANHTQTMESQGRDGNSMVQPNHRGKGKREQGSFSGGSTTAVARDELRRAATFVAENPLTDDLVEAWEPVRAVLRNAVSENTFNLWLAHLHPHALNGTVVLGAPADISVWVRDRFLKVLETTVGGPVQVIACGCPGVQG